MDAIEVEPVGDDTYVIVIHGSISFSSYQRFRETLDNVLLREPSRLLIDLSDVSFFNSQGFGELMRAYTSLAKRGDEFALINPSDEVRKHLERTKVATIIAIFPSREAALE